MTARPPPPGRWTSSRTTVGLPLPYQLDGCIHRVGLTDELHMGPDFGADSSTEQIVIVDKEDRWLLAHPLPASAGVGILSRTSVPEPGLLIMSTEPP